MLELMLRLVDAACVGSYIPAVAFLVVTALAVSLLDIAEVLGVIAATSLSSSYRFDTAGRSCWFGFDVVFGSTGAGGAC